MSESILKPVAAFVNVICTAGSVFVFMSSTWQYACCALSATPDGVFGPADGLPHCVVTHDRRAVSSHMRFTALVIEDVSPPLPLVAVSYCWCMAYR